MRALKVILFIGFLSGVIYALLLLFFPGQLADAGYGPQDMAWAPLLVPLYLGLATANWYAFHNPRKNVAVVRALIVMWGLFPLAHLYNGAIGAEEWGIALPSLIVDAVMAALLVYFYPRGEKAT